MNGFAETARQEAAYLFLQWLGGARTRTWLSASFSGLLDPLHTYSLADPLVAEVFGEQPLTKYPEIMPRTAPTGTLPGAQEYGQALQEELHKHLTSEQSAEQAMQNVENRWNQLTESLGYN